MIDVNERPTATLGSVETSVAAGQVRRIVLNDLAITRQHMEHGLTSKGNMSGQGESRVQCLPGRLRKIAWIGNCITITFVTVSYISLTILTAPTTNNAAFLTAAGKWSTEEGSHSPGGL